MSIGMKNLTESQNKKMVNKCPSIVKTIVNPKIPPNLFFC